MDRNLTLEVVRITEAAALASAKVMGLGDAKLADDVAVKAMRQAFEKIPVRGRVVIGEGERDKAPMLYIGEELGRRDSNDPLIDIAVDPLEGTDLCAYGRPNALSVIAVGEKGQLLNAPDIYMEKIAVGPKAAHVISLTKSVSQNLKDVAMAKKVSVDTLTCVVLERERHTNLIKEIRTAGAKVKLIPDGDVSAAIATCFDDSGVDLLMGIGGAPEGVLAAAALKCLGGAIQTRLVADSPEKIKRCQDMGLNPANQILDIHHLVKGDVIFAATGVTDGDMLSGIKFFEGGAKSNSLVMRSKTKTVRKIKTVHNYS